ncbi:MAG: class I SAM-dependent methyltransferase [Candidatus Thorarchaeota archaeon]|nr:class I SAM-dependent methyltransferase [Candidatus Thorarchaeota archaeon]
MNIFKTVQQSYDRMGATYHRFRDNEKFRGELERFSTLLPPSGRVLDAGCGVGTPTSEFLVRRGFDVTGVDISQKMIDLARVNVPDATFYQQNLLDLDFPDSSFDGVICVYTLWHIPRSNHQAILQKFHRVLKSDGILVINTGTSESEGMSEFFGEPMLWSTNDPKDTLAVIQNLGFDVLFEGILKLGGERQYWVFAKKTSETFAE